MSLLSLQEPNRPSLFHDIRTGSAGAASRVAVSLASALVLVAAALFAVWAAQRVAGYRNEDEVVAGALGGAGLVWCLTQMWLWRSYRRFRVFLNGLFSVIAIWVVVVPVCFMIESAVRRNEELLISGVILCGIAVTLLRLAVLWHRQHRGKALVRPDGQVNVNCPECGYVMVGLSESRCPECGARFTLDELIRRQEYDALRFPNRVLSPPEIPASDSVRRAHHDPQSV